LKLFCDNRLFSERALVLLSLWSHKKIQHKLFLVPFLSKTKILSIFSCSASTRTEYLYLFDSRFISPQTSNDNRHRHEFVLRDSSTRIKYSLEGLRFDRAGHRHLFAALTTKRLSHSLIDVCSEKRKETHYNFCKLTNCGFVFK
jgi:hypothetical protein